MTNVSPIHVPNEGPKNASIFLVGEAPGWEEERDKRPFVGQSGNLLMTCLGRNGTNRENVRLLNLCHYRPEKNRFRILLPKKELREGIEELKAEIRSARPNVIGALGNWPLYFLTGRQGKAPGTGINNWRGSILECTLEGCEGIKVIPTYHPAYVARDRSKYPIFDIDIKRIISDSEFPELRLPKREYVINPKGDKLEHYVQQLLKADRLAVDIETYGMDLACIGFAPSPELGVSIEWDEKDFLARDAITRLLTSNVKKILHFGTFDYLVLTDPRYNFEVNNFWWDTYVSQQAMWAELPRSLAYLASVHTREPYYKFERKGEEAAASDVKSWNPKTTRKEQLMRYNCKDVCVTAEVQLEHEKEMGEGPKGWRKIFDFEMSMLPALHDISRTGMLIDQERRKLLDYVTQYQWYDYQKGLNKLVGAELNVNSPKQVQMLLYEVLKLPMKKSRATGRPTADEDAIVSLISFVQTKVNSLVQEKAIREWKRRLAILKGVLIIRGIRKLRSSYIDIAISDDGRVRSIYKWGTETGRLSAEKYVDGTGLNPQTFPRDPIEVPEDVMEKILELMEEGE